MRILLLPVILFSVFCSAQTKRLPVESSIAGVTVFASGAQILRTASAAVTPGRTEVVFTGLSNQLEQQSLQLKADANITLLSVQAIRDFSSQRKLEADERALLDSRTDLQEKLAMDSRLLQVYKKEEEMLEKNQAIGGQTGVKPEDLRQALDLQRARMTEVLQKQLEIEKRIAAQQRELQKLNLQIAEVGKKRDSVAYTVTALIDSRTTQNIKFQLSYTVKDAGWYPTYDMRVADITKPLHVLMNANVFQRSGETWKDVAIQLSTGNPGDNATPSELQPWMLGFYDPSVAWVKNKATIPGVISGRIVDKNGSPVIGATVAVKGNTTATVTDANGFFKLQNLPVNSTVVISAVGYVSKEIKATPGYLTVTLEQHSMALQEVVVTGYGLQGKVAGVSVRGAASTGANTEEIQNVAVAMQYQPTAVIYRIDEKYTLETDGKTTTIGIKKFEIPALYEYYSAPKIDPSAFLTAKVVAWQEYDLQSGETNLYYEGTFLGKTYLDLSTVNDTLSLSLGKDNSIRVSRKLLKEFSAKKFLGSNKTETKEYEITVMNTKKVPATILVRDQYPVSVNKEISVDDVSAPEATLDKETGLITWNFALQPGQEKKLKLRYIVKYPKDRTVVLE
ncbi:MAG TPA: mucoidy inhibitor MuiA family protein [Flavisolibacter sp.]|nr:mucoidy inhibitor MuiA family protein [Flavisolibacter sp.]